MLRRFDKLICYRFSINFRMTEQHENVNRDEYKILDFKHFISTSVGDKAHHQMQKHFQGLSFDIANHNFWTDP